MSDKNYKRLRYRRLSSLGALGLAAALSACQSVGTKPDAPPAVADAPSDVTLEPIDVPYVPLRDAVVEQRDLLARLRGGFSWPTEPVRPTVAHELDWYKGHQQYLDRVFQRADLYLYYIVDELERRDMPAELALLPIVESAFDPFAYSDGRAAGLWQIIPGTGKRLGLEQNWWYDGRRDVVESTRAALDYLEAMHEEFGDWLLAVAGYNTGEGNVERAVARAKAAGKPQDFWGIRGYLPNETQAYVPRLLAVRELVADPLKYGVSLPALTNERRFAVVDIGSQIDMALAAELAGIDTTELYQLNPGVNRWATDPEGPHRLVVPAEQAAAFEAALASLGEKERVRWERHQVKPGETIGGLADKYQTTVAVLREVNSLRSNTLHAGQSLLIPTAAAASSKYALSADARAARASGAAGSGERREHEVQAGETLWSIARDFGVDMRSLARWNSMAPGDVLSVGRELVVWTKEPGGAASGSPSQPAPAAATPATATAPQAAPIAIPAALKSAQLRELTYVVRPGDSLSSIARRFRVSVPELRQWNSVADEQILRPGQRLKMFVDVTEQSG
ncbi:MAG TPA: LysM peptidoglycan-binding domain-containing protein [Gammaproteobacteria bacterium]|nr:LysM peptidoglycan-binding domain-containing protein [Gammaproteobacteria bacterium]